MSISSAIDQIVSDWKDLLSGLVTGKVVWVNPTPENAARLHLTLAQFGAPLKGITAEFFTADAHARYH